MAGVQLAKTEISLVVRAMTQALHEQGHLVHIEKGMPGWGSKPSAPVFVIPKSDVKCSFTDVVCCCIEFQLLVLCLCKTRSRILMPCTPPHPTLGTVEQFFLRNTFYPISV